MTARIEIRNGPEAGRVFQIEEDLCRIGSGPASTLRVEGIDEHALTVHYRDGQYFVINRCRHPIRLDRRKLQPNESAAWEHRQVLQVNGQHAFALNLAEDPAPAAKVTRASPSDLRQVDAGEPEEPLPPQPNRARQIVIIALSLLGVFLLISSQRQPGTQAIQAEFDRIVGEMARTVAADDVRLCFVRENLKVARALEFQGRYPEAASKYAEIRKKCLSRNNLDADRSSGAMRAFEHLPGVEDFAREFVARRLEALGIR